MQAVISNTQSAITELEIQVLSHKNSLLVIRHGFAYVIVKQQLKNPNELATWGHINTQSNLKGRLIPPFTASEIILQPKQQTPVCIDYHRAKYWVVLSGQGILTINQTSQLITAKQAILLPPMSQCQLTCHQSSTLTLLQFESTNKLNGNERFTFEQPLLDNQ